MSPVTGIKPNFVFCSYVGKLPGLWPFFLGKARLLSFVTNMNDFILFSFQALAKAKSLENKNIQTA